MKLSDIIKKKSEKEIQKEKPQEELLQPKSPPVLEEKPTIVQEIKQLDSAEKVYSNLISIVRTIFGVVEKEKIAVSVILNVIRKVISLIVAKNEELISMCEYTTPDLYLYSHVANVCILSIMLGEGLKYSNEDLEKIGLCAILHDLGMIKVMDIASKPSKISPQDFREIKKHQDYVSSLIENIEMTSQTKEFVKNVVQQIHERKNGSGYPKGLSGEDINVFARIISIADVYEALTHPRAWRERYLPHEALKKIIESAEDEFDLNFLKIFIEKMSLYPLGSYVRLNSEEIARVIGINPGLPTRPKVKVIVDNEGKKVQEQKIIDLSKTGVMYILEPVDETKLEISDKKLMLELKARKWWVKNI